jgi:hypothetical protein
MQSPANVTCPSTASAVDPRCASDQLPWQGTGRRAQPHLSCHKHGAWRSDAAARRGRSVGIELEEGCAVWTVEIVRRSRGGPASRSRLSSLHRRSARYRILRGVGDEADLRYEVLSGHALLRNECVGAIAYYALSCMPPMVVAIVIPAFVVRVGTPEHRGTPRGPRSRRMGRMRRAVYFWLMLRRCLEREACPMYNCILAGLAAGGCNI